jgi:thioredoxin 1
MLQVKNPETFQTAVVQSSEPTVVMFWATWCPFCRRFKQEFERLATSQPWRFAAVYLDDEENPLWEDYAVGVVPTLALFRDGKLVERLDGILGYGIDSQMIEDFVRRVRPGLA